MTLTEERDKLVDLVRTQTEKLARTEHQLEIAVSALRLISSPKRIDGTYNRSREACEQLACMALDEIASPSAAGDEK